MTLQTENAWNISVETKDGDLVLKATRDYDLDNMLPESVERDGAVIWRDEDDGLSVREKNKKMLESVGKWISENGEVQE